MIIKSRLIGSTIIKSRLVRQTIVTNRLVGLGLKGSGGIRYNYHMKYFLDLPSQDDITRINDACYHLFVKNMINKPFNERIASSIMLDCHRLGRDHQTFQVIFDYMYENRHKMENQMTLIWLLVMMYLYKMNNAQKAYLIAKSVLSLKHMHFTGGYSYLMMKLLIAISELTGLSKFTNQEYQTINFKSFKPIMICFTLELFYKAKIQQNYPFLKDLIKMLVAFKQFIPYGDIHHLSFATRTVTDPEFRDLVNHLKQNVTSTSETSSVTPANTSKSASLINFRDKLAYYEEYRYKLKLKYQ